MTVRGSGERERLTALLPPGRAASARQLRLLAAALVVAMFASACSSDPVDDDDYSQEHRSAFLAACTTSAEDDRLVRDMCECTYDRLVGAMAYADFVALEESLRLDSLTPLPDGVTELVADCFLAEVDL